MTTIEVPAIEFEGVWRMYGRVAALRGVDLRIDEPCVYGLVGRNGSGKTTLLRMVPCLLHPTRGTVRVFGLDPWEHQDEVKRRIGYLGEEDAWPPLFRARDVLDAYAALQPRWDAELEHRFSRASRSGGTGVSRRSPRGSAGWSGYSVRCAATPTCWSSTNPRADSTPWSGGSSWAW